MQRVLKVLQWSGWWALQQQLSLQQRLIEQQQQQISAQQQEIEQLKEDYCIEGIKYWLWVVTSEQICVLMLAPMFSFLETMRLQGENAITQLCELLSLSGRSPPGGEC